MNPQPLIVRDLGVVEYKQAYSAMVAFNDARTDKSADELWLLEHPPVFTLGRIGKREHILQANTIPIVETDRGGQVTYHGPGQLVVYTLFDVRRMDIGVRDLVTILEKATIGLLAGYGIASEARRDAPGVYVNGQKIASLGLRIKRGGSYHGLSINIDMDLTPFELVNPCGYPGLKVTQVKEHLNHFDMTEIKQRLVKILSTQLGYNARWDGTTISQRFPSDNEEISA